MLIETFEDYITLQKEHNKIKKRMKEIGDVHLSSACRNILASKDENVSDLTKAVATILLGKLK